MTKMEKSCEKYVLHTKSVKKQSTRMRVASIYNEWLQFTGLFWKQFPFINTKTQTYSS